jgi:hypothetical protein
MSIFCECGNEPGEDSKYCRLCGKEFAPEEETEPWDRSIEQIPCIQIEAGDWLHKKDVREWIAENDIAYWRFAGDLFTVYDHGEGPDCPGTDGKMPWWLWNTIKRIAMEKGIDYCIVRLMNVEPHVEKDPVDILLGHIDDLADENECKTDWEKGTFGDLLKNIVASAEEVKKARKE